MKWATVRIASIRFWVVPLSLAAICLTPSGAALAQGEIPNVVFDSRTYGVEGNYPYANGITLTVQDHRETIGPVDLTGGRFLNIGRVTPQPNALFMLSFELNGESVTYYTTPEAASGATGVQLPEQADLSSSQIEIVGLGAQPIHIEAFTITVQPTPVNGGGGGNANPVANAGTYAPVEADRTGAAAVTLDGSGSTDPNGDTLTYEWTGPFPTATGVSPTVIVPLGTHSITLTVRDGRGGVAQSTTQVVVRDTTGPAVTCRLDPVSGTQRSGRTTKRTFRVVLGATDIADPSPSIAGTINGYAVANGMLVELVRQEGADGSSCATKPDGTLVILSGGFTMTGTGTDASGNASVVTTVPVFEP
jgi:hypothetical protein